MKAKIILAAALVALPLFSCKTAYELLLEGNDVDAKYEAAFDYFNQGKYAKAAQLFESLSIVTNGTERDDTVQYYWGLSNYRARDFYTAETNFTNFATSFPASPFVEDARFLRLDCLYRQTYRYELDQMPTNAAISAINEYLVDYPETANRPILDNALADLEERLDRKAYENAKLYYKMEDYKASRVAFRNILKDDADNLYREDILYYTALSSYKYAEMSIASKKKERYLIFIDDYLNYIGEYPDSGHKRELASMYRKAQRAIGKNVVDADDDQETTASAEE